MAQAASILLGRYGLGEQIGGGGFSEVWEGTDLVLNRPVAIKMLRVAYAEHAETLARFRAEARHAASVSHENIAQVYDYGEADPPSPPFLVMEFVAGPSLAQVLAAGAMDPGRTMKIVAQAAAGLQAAHWAGLVHRDIKPGNLLLAPGDVVKITDFGIAHAAGSAPVTSTGLVIGTAGYLAPERVAGRRGSAAGDLYALGVIAYECLAGAAPFTGVALEVALCHRERPLPALPASVPADVAALVSELTAKDPAARPGSAGAVARRAAELADRSIGDASAAPCPCPVGEAGRPALAALPPTRVQPMGVRRPRGGPVPGRPGRPGPRWRVSGVRLIRRAAVAAIALVVAMTGLVMASVIGPSAPGRPLPVPSSRTTSRPASSAVRPEGTVARTRVNAKQGAPGQGRDRVGDQGHGNGPGYGGGQGHGNGNGRGHGNSDGNGHGHGHGNDNPGRGANQGNGNGPGQGGGPGSGNGPGQGGGPGSGNGPASGGPSVADIQVGDNNQL
jgi:eukaryotic-like serine/threonine-protein kinase